MSATMGRMNASARTVEAAFDYEEVRRVYEQVRGVARDLSRAEAVALAKRVLADAGYPKADQVDVWPLEGDMARRLHGVVAWDFEEGGGMKAKPLIMMRPDSHDEFTLLHECAHLIRNGPEMFGRRSAGTDLANESHDQRWWDTFTRLIGFYATPLLGSAFRSLVLRQVEPELLRTAGPAGDYVPLDRFPIRRPNHYGPRDVFILRPAQKDIDRLDPGLRSKVEAALTMLSAGMVEVEPKERPPLVGTYTVRVTNKVRMGLYLSHDQPGGEEHPDWVVYWVGPNHDYSEAERRMRMNASREASQSEIVVSRRARHGQTCERGLSRALRGESTSTTHDYREVPTMRIIRHEAAIGSCRAHGCSCTGYREAGKIGDYPVCECTHSENIHNHPDGGKAPAKKTSAAWHEACPSCGSKDVWPHDKWTQTCGACGIVFDEEGHTWGDMWLYENADFDEGLHEGSLRRQAVTTGLWPVTGYGDLVHVVLGNPEDTDSAPEATKTTLCGQTPWAFHDWSVMPFDGEDYRPISDAEDARQVTCPTCRQAAETSVRTGSRKTAAWTVGDNVPIGGRMYEIASVEDDYLVVGPVDTWPDGKRKVVKPAPGQPLTLTDYSPRKQAAAWSAADVVPGRGSWDGLPLYRDGTPIYINDQVLTPDGKPGTVSSIVPEDFLVPGGAPIGVSMDEDEYSDDPGPAPTYWPHDLTPVNTVYQHHPEGYPRLSLGQARHTALGETLAPAEVDTLRDDACPVCGTMDYRGGACNACGYIKPPVIFHDPDVEKAKQVDLRVSPSAPVDLACDSCGALYPASGTPKVAATAPAKPGSPEDDPDYIPDPDEDVEEEWEEVDPDEEPDEDPDEESTDEEPGEESEEEPVEEPVEAGPTPDPTGERTPQRGDLCPSCGNGTLMPKDEVDGIEQPETDQQSLSDQPQTPGEGVENGANVPDHEKENIVSTTAQRGETPRPRQNPMSRIQNALAAHGRLIRRQAEATDAALAQNRVLREQNARLRKAVEALAASSPQGRAAMAALRHTAADEPVAKTDEQAVAPEATDNVESPGAAPAAANEEVTPEATTDVESTEVVVDQEPINELTDVTEVTEQTQGDGTTHTEPQPSAPASSEVSNPVSESGWTTAGKDKTWPSLRLAQLRLQAGTATGDEVLLAQKIASTMEVEEIAAEAATLEKVVAVAKARTAASVPPRNLVPRRAGGTAAPSLAPTTASREEGSDSGIDLSDSFV